MTGGDSFTRYLAAKRSVDDRALDRRVRDALAAELERRGGGVDVLEVGAGSGAMIERLVGEGLVRRGRYTAVDADAHALADARHRLSSWGPKRGFQVTNRGIKPANRGIRAMDRNGDLELRTAGGAVAVDLVAADLYDVLPSAASAYDLLVGHAVLDVLDLDTALPPLLATLRPGGLCYFPITFDGGTFFEPRLELDDRIAALYHETMDRRRVGGRPSGSSRTGRRLLAALPAAGVDVLAAGASDWVVHPSRSGGYPGDEAYFLGYLLATLEGALAGHPELDPDAFAAWLARRREQVEDGELILVVHQLDVLGRTAVSASPPRSDEAPVARPT